MNRPIKVMHVVESFCGGVFTSIAQIANNLDPERFEVSVVFSLRPETPKNFVALFNASVRLIKLSMSREIEPLKDFRSLIRLYRLFVRERPDVVHLHSSKAGVLGRVAACLARVQTVFYSPRGFAFLRQDVSEKRRVQYRLFERLAARFGGTLVACSHGEWEAARQVTSRAILINNAIDVDSIEQHIQAAKAGRPRRRHKTITVAIAGRIVPQKAPEIFARVAQAVTAARPGHVQFVWIGGGDTVPGLSWAPVQVTGWLAREEALRKIYLDVDIYFHTSLWEGMPLAVLEAMALGKPVVATDCVGNRDVVVRGKTGFLGTGPEQLVQGLLRLIDDPRARRRMGAAGRARVKEGFALPNLIKSISALYENSVGASHVVA